MYFSLHNHSDLSNIRLKDSIIKVEDAINRALKLGLKGIAFTEHECLSSHIAVENYTKN